MTLTVEKTGYISGSMAYQAKAYSKDYEVMSMYGRSAEHARKMCVDELKKLNSEIDDFLTIELINEIAEK